MKTPQAPGAAGWPRSQALGEAAFAAVAAVALFAFGSTLPFPFNPAVLVCPVPLVLVAIRHGPAVGGLIVAFAAGVLAAAQMPGASALSFVLLSGVPAMTLGLCMRRQVSPEWTVGLGAAALCAALALGITIRAGGLGGVGPALGASVGRLDAWLLVVQQFFEGLGSAGDLAGFPETIAALRELVHRAFPGLVGAWAVLFAATVSMLAMALAARTVGTAPPAFAWTLPEGMVWGFIGAAGATLAPWGPWRLIGLNALLVILALYLLQGLSVAGFFCRRLEIPRTIRALAVLMVGIWPPLTILVLAVLTGLGLCDVWVAFRRLDAPGSS